MIVSGKVTYVLHTTFTANVAETRKVREMEYYLRKELEKVINYKHFDEAAKASETIILGHQPQPDITIEVHRVERVQNKLEKRMPHDDEPNGFSEAAGPQSE